MTAASVQTLKEHVHAGVMPSDDVEAESRGFMRFSRTYFSTAAIGKRTRRYNRDLETLKQAFADGFDPFADVEIPEDRRQLLDYADDDLEGLDEDDADVQSGNDQALAASWYDDPTGRHQHRYWDGTRWTDHVADNGQQSTDSY